MLTQLVKIYRSVHTWAGILSALLLFIAFYAGAISMFEEPLRRWSTSRFDFPPAVSLEETPALIEKTLATHPEATRSYVIHYDLEPDAPARLTWSIKTSDDEHAPERIFGAAFDDAGNVVVKELNPSPLAQFIDDLHRQMGLPLSHDLAMPITAAICLLYFLALVSGVIVLIPTLVKNLFLVRTEAKAVRRKWLDVHNLVGLFSLPFHIVIALTALTFAMHDEFYGAQQALVHAKAAPPAMAAPGRPSAPAPALPLLSPTELREKLVEQAPDFHVQSVMVQTSPAGKKMARVFGVSEGVMLRGPTFGIAMADPISGRLVATDYLPGNQPVSLAVVTSFFSLHFGNFGGTPIRWAYVLLGLSGALLFYTGNLLWVEARRKRLVTGDAAVTQPRSVRILAAITVAVCTGTMSGISLTIAVAKWMPATADAALWHTLIFYAALIAAGGWAWGRGAARAGYELLRVCAVSTLMIPVGGYLAEWEKTGVVFETAPGPIEATALAGAILFALMARSARRRALSGPPDSVWTARPASSN